jgi:SAM-dependent methyltransferase
VAGRSIPERVVWAVQTLAVRPGDRLLEIGCGRGAAVSLICERLVDGRITAIDRSAVVIDAAARRNAECVRAGKAVFRCAELAAAEFAGERFDKVFAVNVNLFWVRPADRELRLVGRLLRPGGTLSLFYEPPTADLLADLRARTVGALTAAGFSGIKAVAPSSRARPLLCVVASPPA